MTQPLSDGALDQLFRAARSYAFWSDAPVSETVLRALADLVKMGPTSANCMPARIVFVKSADAKARLLPCMDEGNRAKVTSAPVTAIIGADQAFYEKLPQLFPHADARSWFVGQPEKIAETAMRNSSLQGAYLILAARALGLDAGPMSGFDKEAVDRTFFADTTVEANFICNLGYGDPARLHPRLPRPAFDEFCQIE